ncbi:hypothetical protein [Xanthomonas axonopodis]|uniref:hypothetical protein n=1 Tax=Xanthomonas axonopodis TaxID=53413 RepID=UPI001431D118|nr:hypothetical protein [Xanthomonas axonopodis]
MAITQQVTCHTRHRAFTPTAVDIFCEGVQEQSGRVATQPHKIIGLIDLPGDPRDCLHARGLVRVLAQLVAHMRQLLQRCAFEPPGLVEVLRCKLGATIEIAGRSPPGALCIGNQLKVFVEPTGVDLRMQTLFQEGQRHPAAHAIGQLVVACHRYAQVDVVVPADSVGLAQLSQLLLSLRL